jgi:hypothetical protein
MYNGLPQLGKVVVTRAGDAVGACPDGSRNQRLEGQNICLVDKSTAAEFKCPQAATADEFGDSLTRDSTET